MHYMFIVMCRKAKNRHKILNSDLSISTKYGGYDIFLKSFLIINSYFDIYKKWPKVANK